MLLSSAYCFAPSFRELWHNNKIPEINEGVWDLASLNLTCLEGLENFPAADTVTYLVLMNNEIRDISPLKKLKNLKCLELGGNPIKSFNSLNECGSLKWFAADFSACDKNDVSQILKGAGFVRHCIGKKRLELFLSYLAVWTGVNLFESYCNLTDVFVRKNCLDGFNLFCCLNKKGLVDLSAIDSTNCCPICFDSLESYGVQLFCCGAMFHRTCLNKYIQETKYKNQAVCCLICSEKIPNNLSRSVRRRH